MEKLLKLLEDNARLPLEDIAVMLGKSPAEVSAMMDLAKAQGLIKRLHAVHGQTVRHSESAKISFRQYL